ncbi:MAG: hypothetical protein ACRCTR_06255 [Actinomycetota bacterium]
MRVATVDAYGHALNAYAAEYPLDADEPDRPWAVNLAGANGAYRLLAFDLDAKTQENAVVADRDARMLADLLADVGLPSVVCESGPTGGRHVWTGLAESVDAETIRILAEQARRLCPTLDIAPLSNPATGCVRPPGAPHRSGGRSTVIAGDLSAITAPAGTAAQVRALVERVIQLGGPVEPTIAAHAGPIPLDDQAHPYLPGAKRSLPTNQSPAPQVSTEGAQGVAWYRRFLFSA